jgi:hypothetical protein
VKARDRRLGALRGELRHAAKACEYRATPPCPYGSSPAWARGERVEGLREGELQQATIERPQAPTEPTGNGRPVKEVVVEAARALLPVTAWSGRLLGGRQDQRLVF